MKCLALKINPPWLIWMEWGLRARSPGERRQEMDRRPSPVPPPKFQLIPLSHRSSCWVNCRPGRIALSTHTDSLEGEYLISQPHLLQLPLSLHAHSCPAAPAETPREQAQPLRLEMRKDGLFFQVHFISASKMSEAGRTLSFCKRLGIKNLGSVGLFRRSRRFRRSKGRPWKL